MTTFAPARHPSGCGAPGAVFSPEDGTRRRFHGPLGRRDPDEPADVKRNPKHNVLDSLARAANSVHTL
ncbi:hypothetical protein [Streptomyces sp. NPDC051014]|uniref:hypothetical protein n=1 Tax=Streptomyces sp. NPDC051014 TaxID=3155751 RepID=UPI0033D55233